MLSFFSAIFLIISIYTGCGGDGGGALPASVASISGQAVETDEPLVVDNDDAYYAALEKKLNDELAAGRTPDKCAAQGLSKITLSFATDEINTCSTKK